MHSPLIFDCDGTLADTMPAHYKAWLDVLAPFGVPFPEPRFYAMGGMPTAEISRILFSEAGLTVDVRAMATAKEEAFLTRLSAVQPLEKVVSVARTGRGQRPMAVASGGQRSVVELTLAQIGVRDWFEVIVTSEDTTRHKPEPDVFLEAARRLGVTPETCTVYEDTDLGIEAARRAGMKWIDIREL
ncbi:MAG: HAD-IA family hydrolase [Myxococcales bacterium]|nr:HAD-IA family hydrolase [Myxococcales bacterium]